MFSPSVWQDPAAHRHPSWQHGTLWGWAWHIIIIMAWQKSCMDCLSGTATGDCNCYGIIMDWLAQSAVQCVPWPLDDLVNHSWLTQFEHSQASNSCPPQNGWYDMICMLFLLAYLLVNRFVGVPCPDMTKLWMKFEAMNDRGDGTVYIYIYYTYI